MYNNPQELANKIKELRTSNITLGNDKLNYHSETVDMLNSRDKTIANKTAGIVMNQGDDARKSHLHFGGKGEYVTNYNDD